MKSLCFQRKRTARVRCRILTDKVSAIGGIRLSQVVGKVINSMFPYPINPFRRFITQIAWFKIPAEKQDKRYSFAELLFKLGKLLSFFLSSFIGVRRVASRLCFDQERQFVRSSCLFRYNAVNWDIYRAFFGTCGYVASESIGACWHHQ